MGESSAVVSAFTEEQVQRLTKVSARQLRTWAAEGFFVPSVDLSASGLRTRLYSFRDIVCLKVIGKLRAQVPLSELRSTKQKLAHLGDDMWARTTLYVLGKRVVFENGDGEKEEATSGQRVFQIPLRVVTGDMERAVRDMRQRGSELVGKIEKKRMVVQSQPVIAGTRIPVRSVQAFSKAGYSIDDILRQYPTLEREDVKAAIRYEEVA